jgi:hypothetical protein
MRVLTTSRGLTTTAETNAATPAAAARCRSGTFASFGERAAASTASSDPDGAGSGAIAVVVSLHSPPRRVMNDERI